MCIVSQRRVLLLFCLNLKLVNVKRSSSDDFAWLAFYFFFILWISWLSLVQVRMQNYEREDLHIGACECIYIYVYIHNLIVYTCIYWLSGNNYMEHVNITCLIFVGVCIVSTVLGPSMTCKGTGFKRTKRQEPRAEVPLWWRSVV